jgi:hypothetical protein
MADNDVDENQVLPADGSRGWNATHQSGARTGEQIGQDGYAASGLGFDFRVNQAEQLNLLHPLACVLLCSALTAIAEAHSPPDALEL